MPTHRRKFNDPPPEDRGVRASMEDRALGLILHHCRDCGEHAVFELERLSSAARAAMRADRMVCHRCLDKAGRTANGAVAYMGF